jgi:phosphopantetheinyl transferase
MPLFFQQQINSSVSVAIWHTIETEEFLFRQLTLSPTDTASLQSMPLEKRRRERLGCRQALATLLKTDTLDISYTANGAPSCPQGFISFSHAQDYAAAAFSPNSPVGVDIEIFRSNMEMLFPRFMAADDPCRDTKRIPTIEEMHYHWCAKEAAFKLFHQKEIDIVNNIRITPEQAQGTILIDSQMREFSLFSSQTECISAMQLPMMLVCAFLR